MKTKRIISVMLMIAVMLSFALPSFADEDPSVVFEKVRKLVTALGVMTNEEIDSPGYVTRGYAARTAVLLSNGTASGAASGTMFIDVTESTLYAAEIEAAAASSLVRGVGGGMYAPESPIRDNDMAVILLRYAGYDDIGAVDTAKSQLFKNVNGSDPLTYADLANMIYNALKLSVVYIEEISGSGPRYKIDEKNTVLNSVFKIYEEKGLVAENGITALRSGSDIADDAVRIRTAKGDIILKVGETDVADMIGKNITVYYKADDRTDEDTCIAYAVSEMGNNFAEVSLTDIDYGSVSGNDFEYLDEAGNKKKIKISDSADVIYNGTYFSDAGFSISNLDGMEGTLSLTDNDGNFTYDVIVVEAYEAYIIENVLLKDKIIIAKKPNGTVSRISLDETEYDVLGLYNFDGSFGDIEDLTPGTVLSVAANCASADKKICKVIISDKTATGTVAILDEDEIGRKYFEFENLERHYLLKGFSDKLYAGQPAVILLTAKGSAVGLSSGTVFENPVGMITRSMYKKKEDALYISIILANNKHAEFNLTNTLTIDGQAVRDMETAANILAAAAANSKIVFTDGSNNYEVQEGVFPVRYKLNSEDNIVMLDTPCRNTAYEDQETLLPYDASHLFFENNVMGAKYALNDSAQVFVINANPISDVIDRDWIEDTQYCNMSTVSSSVSRGTYFVNSYKMKSGGLYADFVIVFNPWGAKTHSSPLFMVKKVTRVYDDLQDAYTYKVTGIEENREKSYNVSVLYKEFFEKLGEEDNLPERGTVLRLALDDYGNIINTKVVIELDLNADPSQSKIYANNITDGEKSLSKIREYATSTYIVYGYAKERDENMVKVAYKAPDSVISGGTDSSGKTDKENISSLQELLIPVPSSAPLIVYNITKDDIYPGSYDEIYDYKTSGNSCSFLCFIFGSSRVTRGIVLNYTDLVKP